MGELLQRVPCHRCGETLLVWAAAGHFFVGCPYKGCAVTALPREADDAVNIAWHGSQVSPSPPRPETKYKRECGGRCHEAIDSRSPCPECAAEMAPAPPADAATEAVRCEDCDGMGYIAYPTHEPKCGQCGGSGFSTPAPAPSAKEGRS